MSANTWKLTLKDGNTGFAVKRTATKPAATVSTVTVSPATTSVQKGNTQSFSAAVTGENDPAQTVTWDVVGENSADTKITNAGVLTVGSEETAATITIKATSTIDTSKSGSATVTVTEIPVVYHDISIMASPLNGGSVGGAGRVADGGSTTLTANPSSGYRFVKWTLSGNQVSTSKSYQVSNITADATYIAIFQKKSKSSGKNSSDSSEESQNGGSQSTGKGASLDAYVNPLAWNYVQNNPNSLCMIENQGALCRLAFTNAAKSIGYAELFSFNLTLRGTDHLYHTDYGAKSGKFVLTLPTEYQKPGCRMALIGIDQNGKTKVFYDIDSDDTTITIENLEIEGYAFAVVYQ